MSSLPVPGQTRTVTVPGNGTNTLSYELPPGVTFDVQAVLAQIDASAAGDTIATVTLLEQAGVPIAAVPQSKAIPGGGTGRATWALRLAGDGGSSSAVVAPSWKVALNLASGRAEAMGVTATVTDNANTAVFGLGKVALVATWALAANREVEANVVNLDTVPHKYAMGPVYVQNTVTGAQEALRGNTLTVAGGGFGAFAFGPLTFGAALLNLANPLIPKTAAGGTYAITAQFQRVP